jgi:predicted transcriptional regulator
MEEIAMLIRRSRKDAGMSQRELARKARTAQSVIARIELGETSPTWDTLMRIVRASGHTLRTVLEVKPVVDQSILDDVPRILKMTPEQRLNEVAQVSRFITGARRV